MEENKEAKKEEKAIGVDGLVETLKKNGYNPVGIHNLSPFLLGATSPNFKKKKQGKVTLVLPNEIFNNSDDLRQLNKGRVIDLTTNGRGDVVEYFGVMIPSYFIRERLLGVGVADCSLVWYWDSLQKRKVKK